VLPQSRQRFDRWFGAALSGAESLGRTVRARHEPNAAPGRVGWFEVMRREAGFDGNVDVTRTKLRGDGIVAGVDQIGEGGMAFGGMFAHETATLDAGGRTRIRTFQPAVHARHMVDVWRTDALLAYGWHDYESSHAVGLGGVARGETSGRHWLASLRTSREISRGGLSVTPAVGLQYFDWEADGFTESGVGEAALRMAKQGGSSLTAQLGARLAWTIQTDRARVTPHVEGHWRHEFRDDRRDLGAELAGAGFVVRGQRPATEGWTLAAGVETTVSDRLSVYVRLHREGDTAVSSSTEYKAGVNYRF